MDKAIILFRKHYSPQLTPLELIKILEEHSHGEVKIACESYGSMIYSVTVIIKNVQSFVASDRFKKVAMENAAQLAYDYLTKIEGILDCEENRFEEPPPNVSIGRQIIPLSPFPQVSKKVSCVSYLGSDSGIQDVDDSKEFFKPYLLTDTETKHLLVNLKAQKLLVEYHCKLYIDSENYEPAYFAIICLHEMGDFFAKSITSNDAIKDVVLKLKTHLQKFSPDLFQKLMDFSPKSENIFNRIDFYKAKMIKLFNSVYSLEKSPAEIMVNFVKLIKKHEPSKFCFYSSERLVENTKLYNAKFKLEKFVKFSAHGITPKNAEERVLNKAFEHFIKISRMIIGFNAVYYPEISIEDLIKVMDELLKQHKVVLEFSTVTCADGFKATFSVVDMRQFNVVSPDDNNAKIDAFRNASYYLRLLPPLVSVSPKASKALLLDSEEEISDISISNISNFESKNMENRTEHLRIMDSQPNNQQNSPQKQNSSKSGPSNSQCQPSYYHNENSNIGNQISGSNNSKPFFSQSKNANYPKFMNGSHKISQFTSKCYSNSTHEHTSPIVHSNNSPMKDIQMSPKFLIGPSTFHSNSASLKQLVNSSDSELIDLKQIPKQPISDELLLDLELPSQEFIPIENRKDMVFVDNMFNNMTMSPSKNNDLFDFDNVIDTDIPIVNLSSSNKSNKKSNSNIIDLQGDKLNSNEKLPLRHKVNQVKSPFLKQNPIRLKADSYSLLNSDPCDFGQKLSNSDILPNISNVGDKSVNKNDQFKSNLLDDFQDLDLSKVDSSHSLIDSSKPSDLCPELLIDISNLEDQGKEQITPEDNSNRITQSIILQNMESSHSKQIDLINRFNSIYSLNKTSEDIIKALQGSVLDDVHHTSCITFKTEPMPDKSYLTTIKIEDFSCGFFGSAPTKEASVNSAVTQTVDFLKNLAKMISDFKSINSPTKPPVEIIDELKQKYGKIIKMNTSRNGHQYLTIIQFMYMHNSFTKTGSSDIESKSGAAIDAIQYLQKLANGVMVPLQSGLPLAISLGHGW